MKSLTAVTIIGTFAVTALVYSVACDEMGLEMTDSGIVEMQEELSTCVCRVDGDINKPGNGKTWETACETIEKCVQNIEEEADQFEDCEVWVKKGTVIDSATLELKVGESFQVAHGIKVFGGFSGKEKALNGKRKNMPVQLSAESISQYDNRTQPSISEKDSMEIMSNVFPSPLLGYSSCGCNYFSGIYDNVGIGVEPGSNYGLTVTGSDSNGSSQSVLYLINGSLPFQMLFMDGNEIDSNGTLYLNHNSQQDIRLCDSGGNVGIGTAPSADMKLHINGNDVNSDLSDATLKIEDSNSHTMFLDGNQIERVSYLNYYSGYSLYLVKGGGRVFIGTTNTDGTAKLKVNGKVEAEEIVITSVPSSDYVFEKGYHLRPIEEVESFVSINGHLPDVPSAAEFRKKSVGVGEIQNMLLRKIEELTLYTIEQEKRIREIESRLSECAGN